MFRIYYGLKIYQSHIFSPSLSSIKKNKVNEVIVKMRITEKITSLIKKQDTIEEKQNKKEGKDKLGEEGPTLEVPSATSRFRLQWVSKTLIKPTSCSFFIIPS